MLCDTERPVSKFGVCVRALWRTDILAWVEQHSQEDLLAFIKGTFTTIMIVSVDQIFRSGDT